MKGCALLIESDSVGDAERLFELLSAEGRVTVPFKKQFWGDQYGNFTDKFGVQWAILCRAQA
jgi:PhnB protein